ncbi:hypothetical protein P7F88_12765 [Vibrio hannami]|uniref:hypothetical protein n=1 Tax=Vibrio hannami TaxID=2717094 RepID=UPI00240F0B11|nr:hypothetical protein [Vibrio hannami]MDG3086915.1 hypothetical protein [Vibrio hannami]
MRRVLLLGDNKTNLISPILEELKKLNLEVDYIDAAELDAQKKYPSVLHKLAAKTYLNFKIQGKRHWGREQYIVSKTDSQYDLVIVFIPAMLNSVIAAQLKSQSRKLICVLWDSLEKSPSGKVLLNYSDKTFSFDDDDCKKGGISHLPSYHLNPLNYLNSPEMDVFSVLYFGDESDVRYQAVKRFAESNSHLKGEIYLINDKINKKSIRINDIELVIQNTKLIGNELEEKLKSTKCILDIVDPRQKGLSFRLGDAYRYNKFLITNNNTIKSELWFQENNFVLSDENYTVPTEFIEKEYTPVESPHCIRNWVKKLIT